MEFKIAPNLEEITRNGNVFECDFNNMHFKWVIAWDCSSMSDKNEGILKQWLQNAIGFASKTWQIAYCLNNGGLPFSSDLYINDKKVKYE